MKTIKYVIALFIFTNVLLSCTSDTAVEDAEIAKLEMEGIQATGGEHAGGLDKDRD